MLSNTVDDASLCCNESDIGVGYSNLMPGPPGTIHKQYDGKKSKLFARVLGVIRNETIDIYPSLPICEIKLAQYNFHSEILYTITLQEGVTRAAVPEVDTRYQGKNILTILNI